MTDYRINTFDEFQEATNEIVAIFVGNDQITDAADAYDSLAKEVNPKLLTGRHDIREWARHLRSTAAVVEHAQMQGEKLTVKELDKAIRDNMG